MKQLFDTWALDKVSVRRRRGARRGAIRRQGYAFVPIRRRGHRKKFSSLGKLDKRQARAARKRPYFPLASFPLYETTPRAWPIDQIMMRYGLRLMKGSSPNRIVASHAS